VENSGLRRDEVTMEWRKLHSGQLCHLYSSRNTEAIVLGWTCSTERGNALKFLVWRHHD